jgi:hypothetical protein
MGIADGAAVAPTTIALILVKSLATHHDGPDASEHLLQDPVVQHPCTVAEWVLAAVIRAGDVPVERGGNVEDHERQECFLSVLLHWPIQTVLIYTDGARRHFSSAIHPIKSRLSVLRPPPTTNDQRDDRQLPRVVMSAAGFGI